MSNQELDEQLKHIGSIFKKALNGELNSEEVNDSPLPKKRGRKCKKIKENVIENLSDIVDDTDSIVTDNTEVDTKKELKIDIKKEDWIKAIYIAEEKQIEKEEQEYLDKLKLCNPDSIIKREYIDTRILNLLIENQQFIEDKKLVSKLVTYRKKLVPGKNYVYVVYNYLKPNKIGRMYATEYGSMQRMQKDIRAILLFNIYFDIDMSNAITPILIRLAKKYNKKYSSLKSYLDNRDEWLSKISNDRDNAKKIILTIIYGGDYKCNNNYLLSSLKVEVEDLKNLVWDLQLIDRSYANPKDTRDEKINSLFSFYVNTEENKILMNIVKTFENNGRDVDILTFDGCAIRKKEGEESFPSQLLALAESNVNRDLGYDITLVQKKFDTSRYDFIKDAISDNSKITAFHAAEKFYQYYNDRIIYMDDTMLMFNPNKGTYTSDRKEMHVILKHYKDRLTFKTKKETKEYFYGTDAENMLNCLEIFAIDSFSDSIEEDMLIKRIDDSFHMIAYTDGLYNWHTGEFIPRYNPYYILYDRENCKMPIEEEGDDKIMEKIFSILFKDSFKEGNESIGNYMFDCLCLALLGKYELRNLIFGIGATSSAKSLLMDVCKRCYGKTSVITVPAYVFLKNGADDQSLQNKDLYKALTRGYKIIFVSEIDVDGKSFDITKLKNFSSGGKDEIFFRRLQKETIGKICKSLIVVLCNGIPYLVGADEAFKSRLKIVKYHYSFVDEVTKPNHKPIDRSIDGLFKTKTYMRCFRLLMMKRCLEIVKNNYIVDIPECVKNELGNYVKTDAEKVMEKLNERYDITKDENDVVLFNELKDFIKSDLNFDDNKIIKLLNEIGLDKTKCIRFRDGSKKMARVGIKLREPEIEITEEKDEIQEVFDRKYEFYQGGYIKFSDIAGFMLPELDITAKALGIWFNKKGIECKKIGSDKVRMNIREKNNIT